MRGVRVSAGGDVRANAAERRAVQMQRSSTGQRSAVNGSVSPVTMRARSAISRKKRCTCQERGRAGSGRVGDWSDGLSS